MRKEEKVTEKARGRAKRTAICLFYALFAVVGFFSFVARPVVNWVGENFGVSIQEIFFTIKSPMKGADIGFLKGAFSVAKPNIILFSIVFIMLVVFDIFFFNRMKISVKVMVKKWHVINIRPIYYLIAMIVVVSALCNTYRYLDVILGISEYLEARTIRTGIYEDYYVNPLEVEIMPVGRTKNIIYIYMESMETTYASKEAGGYQESNYIPGLTELAKRNISFSNNSSLGGWHATSGNGWTMGALFSTTSGIPFAFPVSENAMEGRSVFASGVTNLGDILAQQGYTQEFLCGSDSSFAGRADYFKQHGNYKILGYYEAIREGYMPADYKVWWGFEDHYLYDIAKEELKKLSMSGAPFNLTMLTVDTHHVGGYVCDLCEENYQDQLANVLVCADLQVCEFVEWCKKQDFFENTVIVISGDHPRMDTSLVSEVNFCDRTVYNVFINVDDACLEGIRTEQREFSAMDMFPTVLNAIGFQIEGDRLGLGTNLFSGQNTLMEELGGYENLNSELKKYSEYYDKHFF